MYPVYLAIAFVTMQVVQLLDKGMNAWGLPGPCVLSFGDCPPSLPSTSPFSSFRASSLSSAGSPSTPTPVYVSLVTLYSGSVMTAFETVTSTAPFDLPSPPPTVVINDPTEPSTQHDGPSSEPLFVAPPDDELAATGSSSTLSPPPRSPTTTIEQGLVVVRKPQSAKVHTSEKRASFLLAMIDELVVRVSSALRWISLVILLVVDVIGFAVAALGLPSSFYPRQMFTGVASHSHVHADRAMDSQADSRRMTRIAVEQELNEAQELQQATAAETKRPQADLDSLRSSETIQGNSANGPETSRGLGSSDMPSVETPQGGLPSATSERAQGKRPIRNSDFLDNEAVCPSPNPPGSVAKDANAGRLPPPPSSSGNLQNRLCAKRSWSSVDNGDSEVEQASRSKSVINSSLIE